MKILPVVLLYISLWICAAQTWAAAVYEWTDDKGVVHFTDNADSIPAKYLKKVKERESLKGPVSTAPSAVPADVPHDVNSGGPAGRRAGGNDEALWRSRFSGLREEKKRLESGLVEKREQLNTLRRKKAIYGRGSDRTAFNYQYDNVARDEARIKELEQKLVDLDAEAAKAGVPLGWRQ